MALTPQEQQQLNTLYAQGLITLQQIEEVNQGILSFTEAIIQAENKSLDINNEKLKVAREAYKQSAELTDDIEAQLGIRRKNNKEERELAKLTNSVSSALGKQIKDYNNLSDVKKDIAKNESLVNELQQKALSYDKEQGKLVSEYKNKQSEITKIEASISQLSGEDLINAEKKLLELYDQSDILRNQATQQQEVAILTYEQAETLKEANAQLKIQQENIYNVGKTLGVAGSLVDGLGTGLQKLGVSFLAKDFDKVKESMMGAAAGGASSFTVMGIAIKGVGAALTTALTDPFVKITLLIKIIQTVKDLLFAASSNVNKITKATGLANSEAQKLNTTFNQQMQTSENLFINSERLRESFVALTETTGMMGIYTGEALETFTSLTGQLDLSNDQAEKLTFLARQQGTNTEQTMENVVGIVNNFNKANKSSMNAKEIIKDISEVSSAVVVSLGQNPELLAQAVTEAKALGLTLDQVDKIAGGLLQIESSLQAEMEAELLLGKNLNLEKARSLALDNDLLGLQEEIGNQEEIINAFRTGNRIQQEAAAKALGLSRNELAEMVMMQDKQKLSQEEFIAAYGEQSYEQMQQLEAQEKMNEAMNAFKMQMVEVLSTLQPMIDGITNFVAGLSKSKGAALALKTVLAGLALKAYLNAAYGIYSSLSYIPVVGPALGAAAVIAMTAAIASAASKVTATKDFRQRSGQKAVMSQRLGGLELISPAVEDDIVMGPGIVDKVESAEIGDTLREPSITTAVLDSKRSQTKDTIIRESNSKELERQNKMMNQQLKSVTSVLKSINSKESNSYFDSEKVTRNIGRSTAGFR